MRRDHRAERASRDNAARARGEQYGGASMTPLMWLALGFAIALVPVTSPAAARTRVLVERGRFAARPRRPVGASRVVSPDLVAWLGCGVATIGAAATSDPVVAATVAVGSTTLARLVLVAMRGAAARRREVELLTALRLLTAELDAGGQPGMAFTAAAEACPQHRAVLLAAAQACGRGEDPSLDAPALAGLAQAWRVAVVAGAPMAAVVGRVADDLAGQIEQRRTVMGAIAGARSSAAMLAGLPVLGLALGAAMQAHPLGVLFGTPTGRLLCLFGVSLDAAGLLWTQGLTARAERAR